MTLSAKDNWRVLAKESLASLRIAKEKIGYPVIDAMPSKIEAKTDGHIIVLATKAFDLATANDLIQNKFHVVLWAWRLGENLISKAEQIMTVHHGRLSPKSLEATLRGVKKFEDITDYCLQLEEKYSVIK